jgi:hypothetical protein
MPARVSSPLGFGHRSPIFPFAGSYAGQASIEKREGSALQNFIAEEPFINIPAVIGAVLGHLSASKQSIFYIFPAKISPYDSIYSRIHWHLFAYFIR